MKTRAAARHSPAPLGSDTPAKARPRVLFANKFVPHYREAFYDGVRARLDQSGVGFDVVYGDPLGDDLRKSDAIELGWAIHLPSRSFGVGKRKLIYQPITRLSRSYDLVIVEQANKLLVNPILLSLNRLNMLRVAFWGHGKDFGGGDNFAGRTFKRALAPCAHWWFAYNELSATAVRATGFPDERITRVMNTIDNEALKASLDAITPDDVARQRERLGLRGQNVCIYVGAMYDKKRLAFLLAACAQIRNSVPDFEMLFLGGGVDRPLVDKFADQHPWVVVRGPTFGREKAISLKLAKLFLMPGLVGLAIIDAFTAQVPIVTTRVPYHSPEIDYLIDGVNGEMVASADSVSAYAQAVIALLASEERLGALRSGCAIAAQTYTMDSMINRFTDGVLDALTT